MAEKQNVILVHGFKSEGAAKDLGEYGAALDPEKYNVIPFDYDYNAPLAESADKLAALVRQVGGAHVLAHSMGGLVARGAAERVADEGVVKSLTTIATPFNGHGAAFLGKHLGGVPSNTDMTRGSDYQREVSKPLRGKVRHIMFVADKDGTGNDDETVSVASQTKRKIVQDAEFVRVVQDTHTGVLRNKEIIDDWKRAIEGVGVGLAAKALVSMQRGGK